MDNKNNGQGMQLEIRPEVAQGIYSNFAIISHSHSEFVVDFASTLPGMPKPTVASRIVLAPEHAVRLLHALQENVMRYENTFGKIQLPGKPQGGGTIAPFGSGKA